MKTPQTPVFAVVIALAVCAIPTNNLAAEQAKKDKWADAMAAFRQQDAKQPTAVGSIVFVGSSSIRLWKLDVSFPKLKALNRGFGGSEISDSIRHFELLVAKHRPRLVVMYAGDNDVAGGKSARQVHQDFRTFRQMLKQMLPETRLLYIAIKPSLKRWEMADTMHAANDLIAADCKKDKLATFIDIWTPMLGDDGKPRPELFVDDGLHLNKEGYTLWARVLREHLKPKGVPAE